MSSLSGTDLMSFSKLLLLQFLLQLFRLAQSGMRFRFNCSSAVLTWNRTDVMADAGLVTVRRMIGRDWSWMEEEGEMNPYFASGERGTDWS